jgi:Domain of unknown function (DUF3303)
MMFMVVEHFQKDSAGKVYQRAQTKGRMLPAGLRYVNSWVAKDFGRCFQLMETDDPSLFSKWIEKWRDLVEFDIIPVVSSEEAARSILR